jgi:hypothetical protein
LSFHIGQQVVCISGNSRFWPNEYWRKAVKTLPRLHGIYTVREIRQADELTGLCLEEIVNPPAHFARRFETVFLEPAFDVKHFRPVKRTSIEVFRKLLAPSGLVDA